LVKNHFKAAMVQIPYYKKRDRGGEDAYIVSEELLAVADGVGGWNRKGIDPGIFARELCERVWTEYVGFRGLRSGMSKQLKRPTYSVDLK